MNRRWTLPLAMVLALVAAAAYAAAPKTYQVTGPVLEVTDTMIVVEKDQQRWEILRDASTKIKGDLKVGAKVTIEYRMTATSVDVKAAGEPKAKTEPKGKKK